MCYLIKSHENVNNESGLNKTDKMLTKNLSTSCMYGSAKNTDKSLLSALSFNSLLAGDVCYLCKRSSSANLSLKESLIDKFNFLKPVAETNKLIKCSDCSNLVCQSCGNSSCLDFSEQFVS